MKLKYKGMELEGSASELLSFVRQYEDKPVKPYPYPFGTGYPWWTTTTTGTPKSAGTYTGTGLDTQWTK